MMIKQFINVILQYLCRSICFFLDFLLQKVGEPIKEVAVSRSHLFGIVSDL